MSEFKKFLPLLLKCEGGYVNNPNDKGGCTNKGITLKTFNKYYGVPYHRELCCGDLRQIKDEQVEHIYKDGYWDKCKANYINSQRIANLLVDMAVNSGVKRAVRLMQEIVGVTQDGIVGNITLNAINNSREDLLYNLFRQRRIDYYYDLVDKDPKQAVFLKGWLNRINNYDEKES